MTREEAMRVLGWDGVEPLRKAWRREAFKHHPDRGGDPKRFQHLVAAYEVLLRGDVEPAPEREIRLGLVLDVYSIWWDQIEVPVPAGTQATLSLYREAPGVLLSLGLPLRVGAGRCDLVVGADDERALISGRVVSRSCRRDGCLLSCFLSLDAGRGREGG